MKPAVLLAFLLPLTACTPAPPRASATAEGGLSPAVRAQTTPDPLGADGAVQVVRRYYDALGRKDYAAAYGLWGDGGASSRQTFEEFRAGFAKTARVSVETGPPGRVEGAAGSRYVEVPVAITATTTDGRRQRFRGTYVLRRAVVDGATAAQREWHIDSAHVTAEKPD